MISQLTSADFPNAVLNHPSVRPDVADEGDGFIDLSPYLTNPNFMVLGGDYGIFCVTRLFAGSWEVHTAFLPEGRGEWGRRFAEAGAHRMFVATDCVEILTRVPEGHIAADALTRSMGFRLQFKTPPECLFRGKKVPCAIYGLTIQDWSLRGDWHADRGALFHEWLNKQIAGQSHQPDPDHNRIVGITLAMMAEGQVGKAVTWYNRWAFSARHPLISLISDDPPQIRFDAGILTMKDGEIRLEPCH